MLLRRAAAEAAFVPVRAAVAAGFLLLGAAGCQKVPPSILLIVVDTLRADATGPGPASPFLPRTAATASLTPSIDEWAKGAVRFHRAITPAPFTMPAMAAVMTGAWPDRTGVVAHEPGSTLGSWRGATLAEAASRSGLETAAVVANPWLARRTTGFDRGFATFSRLYAPGEEPGASSAAAVTDETIRLLDAMRGRRFFVWAHYFDPHMPYEPPPAFASRAGATTAPSRVMKDFESKDRDLARLYRGAGYSAAEIDEARRLYEGEVLYTDQEIGRLLAHLESSGLDRNTVVVIASDHGESLGEHGLFFAHDFTLYEELLHVVLAVRAPGLPAGERDDAVSLVDVVPTLCRLAGLACDRTGDGRDLFSTPKSDRTLFAAATPKRSKGTPFDGLEIAGLAGRWTMALRGNLKVIRRPTRAAERFETFDLASDPGETKDLGEDRAGFDLREELAAWRLEMDAARPAAPAHGGRRQRRQDTRTLRSLGYLQ